MSARRPLRISSVFLMLGCVSLPGIASELEQQFQTPPQSAKPLVWWHWMNGNVTAEGIKKDLAWMHEVGIGGVQNFDAHLMTPQVVDERSVYMSPDWAEKFRLALSISDQQNFEFGIAASPGWSETGGPWVAPEDGMKKLVWSETLVTAGQSPISIPAPSGVTGLFQNYASGDTMLGEGEASMASAPAYYADIAVVAYPQPANDKLTIASISTNGTENLDTGAIIDGNYNTATTGQTKPGKPFTVTFDLGKAQTVAAASVAMPMPGMFLPPQLKPVLQASDNGREFSDIAFIDAGITLQTTVSFTPVTARYLRLVMKSNPDGKFKMPSSQAPGSKPPGGFSLPTGEPGTVDAPLLEAAFYSQPKVHRFEVKAGFGTVHDYYPLSYQQQARGIDANAVIDLTDKLNADGTLNWQPESGQWKVVRLGYSLTGKENHPATPEATGLEVDKYDPVAVKAYINHYLDNYKGAAGEENMGGDSGLQALLNDSIEVGPSNWTPAMISEFATRRGYSLLPWLPALPGNIVNNAKQTDQFLYDFRLTLAEMLADNHYAVITKEVNKRGMLHYSEALENERPAIGDGMRMRRSADIPMAAMWAFDTAKQIGPAPQYWSDIREAASVAHVYGQNLVAAESLTAASSPWAFSPADLRPMIDVEFALGVNRPIIHTSVHQPLDKAPGLSLFVFGQYFNRLDTWADYAKPWVTYISRNAYMLQQGRFAADVAYFYGEEAPLTALYSHAPAEDVPDSNAFDYVNRDVIIDLLSVDNGHLITPSGQRYKLLYLGGSSRYMTLAVLKKLEALVKGGATIAGPKPFASPSLNDNPAEFTRIVDELWSGNTGKGRVLGATSVNQAIIEAGIRADFAVQTDNNDSTIMFVHRKTDEQDIYFYTNRKPQHERATFTFNVTANSAWHYNAVTGKVTPLKTTTRNGYSIIERELMPFDSGYIVFDNAPQQQVERIDQASVLASLNQGWQVQFQPGRGAPEQAMPLALGNWADSGVDGIRYFSGTATYRNSLTLAATPKAGEQLILDLGEVKELAQVTINGQDAGILWTAPYAINVAPLLKAGSNDIEIKVTNLWVNRLIGDNQPEAKKTYTFTTINTYYPDAPLRKSGLMGPVLLLSQTTE